MLKEESLSGKPGKFNLWRYISTGHERSIRAKKNILAMVFIKGVSMLTSFLLVPLTIHYLNKDNYGLWLTIYSIISWFGLLDIGLGNGLRNKFAESLANGDRESSRMYLSTAYAMLAIIMGLACILFLVMNSFLNWAEILKVSPGRAYELGKVAAIVFSSFCLQLVVKLISSVLLADQKSAIAGAINTICSVLSLAVVYVLTKTTQGSLLHLSLAVGIINVLVPLAVSFWFFHTYYRDFRPSLKYVNFGHARKLMNVGVMFFLFQSTALIVVATDNIIITRLFGPGQVPAYNIALKYFTPVTMVFGILSTPLWSAYTEAYTLGDMDWIRRSTKKMVRVWLLICVGIIPMIALSGIAYKLWVGEENSPTPGLTIAMGLYVLLAAWNQIFGNFINGVGKMRMAFYLTIVTAVVNIPLCILLAKYAGLGVIGVILASCVSLVPDVLIIPWQYYKIVNKKATGIWDK